MKDAASIMSIIVDPFHLIMKQKEQAHQLTTHLA